MAAFGNIIRGVQMNVLRVDSPSETVLRNAISSAIGQGAAVILLPDCGSTGFSITSALPWVDGVTYQGLPPVLSHSGNVPDNGWTYVGGTWFTGDGTFPLFQAQDSSGNALTTDKGSPDANFTTSSVHGACIYDIGGYNFTYGLWAGAVNQCGPLFLTVRNVYFSGMTQWGVNIKNYMRCTFSRIYTSACANGQIYEQSVPIATLQPGNSDFYDLFDNITGSDLADNAARRKHRHIVWSATGVSNNNQNRVFAVQVNAAGKLSSVKTYSVGNVGGSGQVTVASGQGAELLQGMHVKFTNDGGNGNVNTSDTFIIYSVSGDVVKFCSSRAGAAITGSFNNSVAFKTYGFPRIEIVGGTFGTGGSAGTAGSGVTNSVFDGLEAENCAQSSIYMDNASGITMQVTELYQTVAGEQHFVLRSSQSQNIISCTKTFASDVDGSSVQNIFFGPKDVTNCVGYSTQWFGWNTITGRGSINIGNAPVSSGQYCSLEQRAPSGGRFIYGIMALAQRVHGDYGGSSINAGQAGVIRLTGSGVVTVTLPDIDSHTVGLEFIIINERTGVATIRGTSSKYWWGEASHTDLTLAAPSGRTRSIVWAKAMDNGSGSGFYWAALSMSGTVTIV